MGRLRWDDEPINCGVALLVLLGAAVLTTGYALWSVIA